MQKVVKDIERDTTLVAKDVDERWIIARYIDHRKQNPHNKSNKYGSLQVGLEL